MATAAIILSHHRPDLLAHLVGSLGTMALAVHIDRKSKYRRELTDAVLASRPAGAEPVNFLRPRACQWGSFSIVMALLDGLRWFVTTDRDHVVMLSGQCAVVGSIEEVETDIGRELAGRSLVDAEPLPRKAWVNQGGGMDRLDRFWFSYPGGKKPRAVPVLRRAPPPHLSLHGGSQWMCLSREAAEYVVNYVDRHPRDLNYFKTSLIGDEIFLHTILMGSPLASRITRGTTHYMRWKTGTPHPATLSVKDMEEGAIDKWFARKFDDVQSMQAANRLKRAAFN